MEVISYFHGMWVQTSFQWYGTNPPRYKWASLHHTAGIRLFNPICHYLCVHADKPHYHPINVNYMICVNRPSKITSCLCTEASMHTELNPGTCREAVDMYAVITNQSERSVSLPLSLHAVSSWEDLFSTSLLAPILKNVSFHFCYFINFWTQLSLCFCHYCSVRRYN
jgi:hypothetical protein